MKKILTVITTIALLASLSSLTGCSNAEGTPTDSNSEPVSQTSETGPDNDFQSSDIYTGSGLQDHENLDIPDINSEEYIRAQIEAFDMDDFPAPDGEILKKADAVGIKGSDNYVYAVTYDFAYMRKVQPIFVSTLDDPNSFDWDTMEFKSEPEIPEDLGWFKIKAGDVLDNGLTVKSAEISLGKGFDGMVYGTSAEFEGELTLEGVLYCYPEDGYNIDKGAVIFFPNAVKHPELVTPYDDYDFEPNYFCAPGSNFALLYSGREIWLGGESGLPDGISELFADTDAVKAKVTLTGLGYRRTTTGVKIFAEIKTAEPLA